MPGQRGELSLSSVRISHPRVRMSGIPGSYPHSSSESESSGASTSIEENSSPKVRQPTKRNSSFSKKGSTAQTDAGTRGRSSTMSEKRFLSGIPGGFPLSSSESESSKASILTERDSSPKVSQPTKGISSSEEKSTTKTHSDARGRSSTVSEKRSHRERRESSTQPLTTKNLYTLTRVLEEHAFEHHLPAPAYSEDSTHLGNCSESSIDSLSTTGAVYLGPAYPRPDSPVQTPEPKFSEEGVKVIGGHSRIPSSRFKHAHYPLEDLPGKSGEGAKGKVKRNDSGHKREHGKESRQANRDGKQKEKPKKGERKEKKRFSQKFFEWMTKDWEKAVASGWV